MLLVWLLGKVCTLRARPHLRDCDSLPVSWTHSLSQLQAVGLEAGSGA